MRFIRQDGEFNRKTNYKDPAPIFFREFNVDNTSNAYLRICCPNIAVCYLNGKKITSDIFISPTSVWNKTLYVNRYRVDKYLKIGKNFISIILGNGIKNEGVCSVWNLDKETERNFPEFALELYLKGKLILATDENWKYTNSPIIFNQFRVGEYIDYRIKPDFVNNVKNAVVDKTPPLGKLRLCNFPAVKEFDALNPQKIKKIGSLRYLVDFGKNISGYVELNAIIPEGKEVKLIYAERIKDDCPDFGEMPKHYEAEFQTDKIIGNGEEILFKPNFTYHGFRYLVVEGLEKLSQKDLKAIFIHQNIKQTIKFESSDKALETLFNMSVNALLSNSVHLLTDCPTREKFGWLNDAGCSVETLIYLFDCKKFVFKLLRDFSDSVTDDGRVPCVLPACEWGYNNCIGLFIDSAIFEFADKIYDLYGEVSGYKLVYDKCKKIIENERNRIGCGLCDWAGPYDNLLNPPASVHFTDSILFYKCLSIMTKAASMLNKTEDIKKYSAEKSLFKKRIQNEYLNEDGSAKLCEMPVLSLLIAFELYEDIEPLKIQMKGEIEKHNFHHYCGMISLRYLYEALDKCDLNEYAYKIITAQGFPSYRKWIDDGDTSLCETWDNHSSHNHHMYSSFTMWIIKSLCGFSLDKEKICINKPLDCVEDFKITYSKKGKNYTIIKKGSELKYEDS